MIESRISCSQMTESTDLWVPWRLIWFKLLNNSAEPCNPLGSQWCKNQPWCSINEHSCPRSEDPSNTLGGIWTAWSAIRSGIDAQLTISDKPWCLNAWLWPFGLNQNQHKNLKYPNKSLNLVTSEPQEIEIRYLAPVPLYIPILSWSVVKQMPHTDRLLLASC